MVKLSKIKGANKRKLVITDYCKEFLESDDEEVFIYITKLDYSVKKKIEVMSTNTMTAKKGRQMLKALKDKGVDPSDYDNMSDQDKLALFLDLDLDDDALGNINDNTLNMARTIIDSSVDPELHSFVDDSDNKIHLDFEFINHYFNDELINYIINEINKFSRGFALGKQIKTA